MKKKLAYELSEIGIITPKLIDSGGFCGDSPTRSRTGVPGSSCRNYQERFRISLWSELLHPGHTLLVFLESLPFQDAREAMGPILTEPCGALRTLFIQRTPDCTEMDGAEPSYPAGRAHSRYGIRQPSWYLIRPDQYVAARGTLEELDPLQSYIRRTLTRP